jgi:hypothetical protein
MNIEVEIANRKYLFLRNALIFSIIGYWLIFESSTILVVSLALFGELSPIE